MVARGRRRLRAVFVRAALARKLANLIRRDKHLKQTGKDLLYLFKRDTASCLRAALNLITATVAEPRFQVALTGRCKARAGPAERVVYFITND